METFCAITGGLFLAAAGVFILAVVVGVIFDVLTRRRDGIQTKKIWEHAIGLQYAVDAVGDPGAVETAQFIRLLLSAIRRGAVVSADDFDAFRKRIKYIAAQRPAELDNRTASG